MSLEDQYEAWVRGLMGGGRYAAAQTPTTLCSRCRPSWTP